MRRWNGWGEEAINYPLTLTASQYLTGKLGQGERIADASLEIVLARTQPSKLPEYPGIDTSPLERIYHARGQSLPDWVALRYGRLEMIPDGVAYPTTDLEVREILRYANDDGFKVIPYGGGTSVVGHINPISRDYPTLIVDLTRLKELLHLDQTSQLATFGAGINGPELEANLKPFGLKLGHYPQSFEYSTLGGWIATRSSGQQSYYYGRIEDLFVGGHVETPIGPLDLPIIPASAAGPDLRYTILGSEGRMGIITRVTVRVRPIPEREKFVGVIFHNWTHGIEAVKKIAQMDIQVSMLRLSDARETETAFILSNNETNYMWAKFGLRFLGYNSDNCLLVIGITGSRKAYRSAYQETKSICRQHEGLILGKFIGNQWQKSRFHTPYLRNTLWEHGYAVDTLETAVPWSKVIPTTESILKALSSATPDLNGKVLAFAHLSHVYNHGASIYVTYIFRRTRDPDETMERWKMYKLGATKAILQHGGTISHHHGIGVDHKSYLIEEKGLVGMQLIRASIKTVDSGDILNPGKLIENHQSMPGV